MRLLREAGSVLGQATASLAMHPLRSILTATTVAFGSAVLFVLVSYGTGAPAATAAMLRRMGSTQIQVEPRWTQGPGGGGRRGRRIHIRYDDVPAIRAACPSVESMAAACQPADGPVFGPTRSWPWADLLAVEHDYKDVASLDVLEGRWFTEEEEANHERVVVLNLPLALGLFQGDSPVGQWIDGDGRRFKVIGVHFDAKVFAYSMYTPYASAFGLGDGGRDVETITVKPKRPDLTPDVIREVRRAVATMYHFDPDDPTALRIEEQSGFISRVNAVSAGLEGLVLTIAAVALVLGCLGAANVVGITVVERRSELGLRRAVGATRLRIECEVLAESLVLSLLGGLAGAGLGWIAVTALGPLRLPGSILIGPRADATLLSLGLFLLLFVGAIAGLPAASRAAQLDPVEALRDDG